MRLSALIVGASLSSGALWSAVASAQGPLAALDDTQQLGQRLFNRSCVVCHLAPQITSGQYGPMLSKDSLSGQADVLREVIANGTPRMPGFKVMLQPGQIDAIVAYLKTVPIPPPSPATPGAPPR